PSPTVTPTLSLHDALPISRWRGRRRTPRSQDHAGRAASRWRDSRRHLAVHSLRQQQRTRDLQHRCCLRDHPPPPEGSQRRDVLMAHASPGPVPGNRAEGRHDALVRGLRTLAHTTNGCTVAVILVVLAEAVLGVLGSGEAVTVGALIQAILASLAAWLLRRWEANRDASHDTEV